MTETADAIESWVGRTRETEDLIAPFQARAMAATLDRARAPAEGEPLPPGWHWLYFPELPRPGELGPDGHQKRGGFLPPIPLPRRMWAGNRLRFHRPLVVGERATRRSVIERIEEKQGRAGALAFVTVHHRYEGARGLALEEWHDIVYRAAPAAGAAPPPAEGAPAKAHWRRDITPDEVMLFRYSALTFNGHRIHYDYPYVTNTEGYDGLIVHGPLTATLLLDLVAREAPEQRIAQVRFRALRPLFAGRALTLEAAPENGAIEAWALDADGHAAMRAHIELSEP
jgi:3-methylfumaryl-CoA hydratase